MKIIHKISRFVVQLLFRGISGVEYLINRCFVWLRALRNKTPVANISKPNDPTGWEKSYLQEVAPVTCVKSEITQTILGLTTENDSFLETGCGSGILSAELAVAGRKVAVCDFSQPILDSVKRLFYVSGLQEPDCYLVDLTKPMPFQDGQFDVVWSSGVLEHWTDDELAPIMSELARCAKRCVISLVPNEKSVFYRYGRETAEKYGIAPWGREIPRSSLKNIFEAAGLEDIKEWTVCLPDSPALIGIIDPVFARKIRRWWNAVPDTDPVKTDQGYLLLTVGYKNKSK